MDDKKKVMEEVDKDRRFSIDAAVVRTMKSRKVQQGGKGRGRRENPTTFTAQSAQSPSVSPVSPTLGAVVVNLRRKLRGGCVPLSCPRMVQQGEEDALKRQRALFFQSGAEEKTSLEQEGALLCNGVPVSRVPVSHYSGACLFLPAPS